MTLSNQNVAFNNTIALENASDACGVYFQYQSCNPLPRIKSLGDKTKENISTLHNTRCDVAYGFSQYSQYWATSASAANIFASSFTEEGQTLYVHNGITLPNYEYRANEGNKDLWNLSNIINQQGKTSPTSVLVSEGNYRLWNSINNNEHDEMMKYKTAHDPCPPGYIMENYSVLYWYATISDAVKAKFGYARAAEDDATYKSGYKFYGMYYNGRQVFQEAVKAAGTHRAKIHRQLIEALQIGFSYLTTGHCTVNGINTRLAENPLQKLRQRIHSRRCPQCIQCGQERLAFLFF